jgi:hypothetical protein
VRVGADQEIGKNTGPRASLTAVVSPDPAGVKKRFARQRLDPNLQAVQKYITGAPGLEVNAEFRVCQIADNK